LNELWDKLIIIQKLMGCFDKEELSESEKKYYMLENDIWWIKEANSWFNTGHISNVLEYIKIGTCALFLELWYRFLWARYTEMSWNTYKDHNERGHLQEIEDKHEDIQEYIDMEESFESVYDEEKKYDDDNNKFKDIPPAPSIFFNHTYIYKAVENLESSYFSGQTREWNINDVLKCFIQLVEEKNLSFSRPITREEIIENINYIYNKSLIPFLQNVGIKAYGDLNYSWKWKEEFDSSYIFYVFVIAFKNLTQEGTVPHSQAMISLFPNLFMLSDSRTDCYVSQVCNNIKEKLYETGDLNKDIEEYIFILDELCDERTALDFSIEKYSEMTWDKEDIRYKVYESKIKRLSEIKEQIESLRDELNKRTGSVDLEETTVDTDQSEPIGEKDLELLMPKLENLTKMKNIFKGW